MSNIKWKIILLAMSLLVLIFFSSDFGLIDIEKTAIVTAVAIDYSENGEYELTAQISVPEATDSNTESKSAKIVGKGNTMGGAFKNIGDVSGWFPNLHFCNLIILGGDFAPNNIMHVLDYFARTLRVQDSALVVYSEKKAKDFLDLSTPLDNISSFAIQKILFKNPGFDMEVAKIDIKSFAVGYYAKGGSSYMPIIKSIPIEDQTNQSGGGNSSDMGGLSSMGGQTNGGSTTPQKKKTYFDARTTALFKNGKKVGELESKLTTTYNMLTMSVDGSTFEVNDVLENGVSKNVLLTIFRNTPKISLNATQNDLILDINLDIYCKISDQNIDGVQNDLVTNNPLPQSVKNKAEQIIYNNIVDLIEVSKQTDCDFLQLTEKLYHKHHSHYARYKDNLLSLLKSKISVCVSGQK